MSEIIEKESIKLENVNTLKDYNLRILGNTEQDAIPTPNAPSKIRTVTGEQEINIYGKNILDSSKIVTGTKNGITLSYDKDTQIFTFNGTCTADNTLFELYDTYQIHDKTTKFIAYYISGSVNAKVFFRLFQQDFSSNISLNLTNLSNTNKSIMQIAPTDFVAHSGQNSLRIDNGTTANNFKFKLMLTDSDDTKWEPYQGSTYPLSLGSIELCKIGDYQDYIYKKDDKWWKHKEINNAKFDNTKTFNNTDYVLSTPVDEQITDTKLISQLNNLNNAILYSGENNIITTISPLIDGEGTSINLTPTIKSNIYDIKLKGNTSQQKYSGINLLNNDIDNTTQNGITIQHDDNSVTINGTNTGTGFRWYFKNNITFKANTNYTVYIKVISGNFKPFKSNVDWAALFYIKNNYIAIDNKSSNFIMNFTPTEDIEVLPYFWFGWERNSVQDQDGVFNNFKLQIMIVEGNYTSSTIPSYEPYVGGTASPNPDYPQDIKVVTGDNTINVINKNLLKNQLKSGSLNGITYVVNDNGSITLNGTATNNVILWLTPNIWKYDTSLIVLEPDTYTISFSNNIINGLFLYASYYNKNNEDILGKSQEITTYKILTLTEEVSANYRIQINKDTTLNNVTIYPMIEKGSTKTDYISNKQQSFPISLGSLELCKIGDYQDYIYKNNGKWYKHKVIDKIVLNGDMNWIFFDSKREIGIKSNSVIQISNALIPVTDSTKNETPLFSSHFVKGTQTIVIKGYNFIGFSKWGNDIYLYLPNDYDSIDTAKKWLNTNKPIVYYAISTPIEEEITDTTLINQLNNLSKATTYASETNIVATSDGNNLPVTNYIKAYSSEIINESYPYLDLKYNLPYTEKLENLDFYLNENGRLVIKNVGTYLCSISESEIPDMPEASETTVKIAGRDGDLVLATTYNPIQFSIVIYTDENLSPAEKIEERQKIYKFFHEMKNTFKTFGIEAASKFYRVKYAGDVECENHPKHLKFTLPFKSSVSYGYNFKDKELIGNNIAISNTIEPVGFKCIINGPATNPTISLNNNEMKYEASIVNNEKIIIDTNNSTVTSITDNNESNAIVHYNRVFPKIQNGKNELKILSGIDNPTQVKIEWNDYNL